MLEFSKKKAAQLKRKLASLPSLVTSQDITEDQYESFSDSSPVLAPTSVLFSLASEKLEDDDKSRIAVKLLQLSKPKEMNKELPTFPKLSEKTELRELRELFNILKMDSDWLALPPAKWDTNPDYIKFRKFVRQSR